MSVNSSYCDSSTYSPSTDLSDRSDLGYDNEALDVALNELFGADNTLPEIDPSAYPQPRGQTDPQQNTKIGLPNKFNQAQLLPDSPPYSGSEPYSPADNKLPSPSSSDVSSQPSTYQNGSPAPQYQQPTTELPRMLPTQQQLQQAINEQQHLQRQLQLQQHIAQQQQMQQMLQGGRPPHPAMGVHPDMNAEVVPQYCVETNSPFPSVNKKRKFPGPEVCGNVSPPGTGSNSSSPPMSQHAQHVKQEPVAVPTCDYETDNSQMDMSPSMLGGGSYQPIKWSPFQHTAWAPVVRAHGTYTSPVQVRTYKLDGDKGFNFSQVDKAFVCQKKNHFQITTCLSITDRPQFVMTQEGPKQIDDDCLYLHFYGVKEEAPNQLIQVDQSQADRSKKKFAPVPLRFNGDHTWKVTIGRLHFSDTTLNNMRKRGKPNPDQRYFLLVVGVFAHCGGKEYPLIQQCSERLIVRASNPGQFQDSESDSVKWQPGQTPNSVYHQGKVGINTENPDEALTVAGNVKVMGHIVQPSDRRVKEDITETDTKDQLDNLRNITLYNYKYTEEFADAAGIEQDCLETGVIAQELEVVIPEAVKTTGNVTLENGEVIENLKVVDKNRLFMESLGAVKELCNVTDSLENKITYLERFNKKLSKFKRVGSIKSIGSADTDLSRMTSISTISHLKYSRKGRDMKKEMKSVCSNRFLQILIMTLVFIMVACIGVILTLLMLDKDKTEAINKENSVLQSTSQTIPNGDPMRTTESPMERFLRVCPVERRKVLRGKNCTGVLGVDDPNKCSRLHCTNVCAQGDAPSINDRLKHLQTTTEHPFSVALNTNEQYMVTYGQKLEKENARYKRSEVSPLGNINDPLEYLKLDITHPVRYTLDTATNCLDCNKTCQYGSENNPCRTFNYLVQVDSTHGGSMSQLQVSPRSAAYENIKVSHCGKTQSTKCVDDSGDEGAIEAAPVTDIPIQLPTTFPINIGIYEKSRVELRVLDSGASVNECDSEPNDSSIKINIWFVRICSECLQDHSELQARHRLY